MGTHFVVSSSKEAVFLSSMLVEGTLCGDAATVENGSTARQDTNAVCCRSALATGRSAPRGSGTNLVIDHVCLQYRSIMTYLSVQGDEALPFHHQKSQRPPIQDRPSSNGRSAITGKFRGGVTSHRYLCSDACLVLDTRTTRCMACMFW